MLIDRAKMIYVVFINFYMYKKIFLVLFFLLPSYVFADVTAESVSPSGGSAVYVLTDRAYPFVSVFNWDDLGIVSLFVSSLYETNDCTGSVTNINGVGSYRYSLTDQQGLVYWNLDPLDVDISFSSYQVGVVDAFDVETDYCVTLDPFLVSFLPAATSTVSATMIDNPVLDLFLGMIIFFISMMIPIWVIKPTNKHGT